MIPTFACVLKMGGEYFPHHVQALSNQVKRHTTVPYRFVCFSDVQIPGVETIPLENGWPGWWSVPEVFRSIGPTIVVGVDTVIWSNIDSFFNFALKCPGREFWMIRNFRGMDRTISGIMIWNGDWSFIYREFDYKNTVRSLRGEEDYTNVKLRENGIEPGRLQDKLKGIYSWKNHCRNGIPSDASIIVFHGKPRPFEVHPFWEDINKE